MDDTLIARAFATLPSEAQELLHLRYERGLAVEDIARRVHQPRDVVQLRLRCALLAAERAVRRQQCPPRPTLFEKLREALVSLAHYEASMSRRVPS